MICFSVVDPLSLKEVPGIVAEIQRHCPIAPYILAGRYFGLISFLGTKIDLRDNDEVIAKLEAKGIKVITPQMGEATAAEIGALSYHE